MSLLEDISVADLAPERVHAFLRAHGWMEIETRRTGALWGRITHRAEGPLLFVPRPGIQNFDRRMRELLVDLAEVGDVPLDLLVRRYEEAARDLIRLRVVAAESARGELPFNYARRMLDSLRDLLWAGARAAHEPLASFPRQSKVKAVDRFIQNLTLGQTEEGSFVVQVLSPIAGDWQLSVLTDREVPEDKLPFERLATMRLADGVEAAQEVAGLATVGLGDSPELERAVAKGLSANLCTALAALSTEEVPAAIELQVAWASLRRMPQEMTRVELQPERLRRLTYVADLLSEHKPMPNFKLSGAVTEMKHVRSLEGGGRIVVASRDLPGRARTVYIDLADDDAYKVASAAHVEHRTASFGGTLHYGGNKWVLLEAQLLGVHGAEPPDS